MVGWVVHGWVERDQMVIQHPKTQFCTKYGFDCTKCAPAVPGVAWKVVSKGGKQRYQPQEDVQEAGAYENALKSRPQPFKFQLRKEGDFGRLQIGVNGMSLVQRARALCTSTGVGLTVQRVTRTSRRAGLTVQSILCTSKRQA